MGITNKDVLKTVAIDVPNMKSQLESIALDLTTIGVDEDHEDNSEIIQKKIDSIEVFNFFLPKGKFTINKLDLNGKSGVLKGVKGETTIVIDKLQEGFHGIFSDNFDKIEFENINFIINDGHIIGLGNTGGAGMCFRNGNEIIFKNCYFDNTKQPEDSYVGIHVKSVDKFVFKNNSGIYKGSLVLGLGMSHRPTNITKIRVSGNDFKATSKALSLVEFDNEPLEINNQYKYCDVNISNNRVKADTLIEAQAFGIGYIKNGIISNNHIYNFRCGFDIDNPLSVIITNNIIKCFIDGSHYSIRVSTSASQGGDYEKYQECENVLITNNIIEGYPIGVTTGICYNVNIVDNTFINNILNIKTYNSNNVFICGNTFDMYLNSTVLELNKTSNTLFRNNIITTKISNANITLFKFLRNIDGVDIVNNSCYVKPSNIYRYFIVDTSEDNKFNIQVESNIGINDQTKDLFIGKIVFGGMKFRNQRVIGTVGKPVMLTDNLYDESYETSIVVSQQKTIGTIYKNIECVVNATSYNLFMSSNIIDENKNGYFSVRILANMDITKGVIVNFNGEKWSTDVLNGVSRTHTIKNVNEKLDFYFCNGKLYKLN